MGRAQRIMLKSSVGIQAFGDLVYPADYRAGQRYPLIVVQYESRGFLRGGTGDEFPIQAFASNGFAVLRSEEHTSELQSLMRISYAVFCLKKKKTIKRSSLNKTYSMIKCTTTHNKHNKKQK